MGEPPEVRLTIELLFFDTRNVPHAEFQERELRKISE